MRGRLELRLKCAYMLKFARLDRTQQLNAVLLAQFLSKDFHRQPVDTLLQGDEQSIRANFTLDNADRNASLASYGRRDGLHTLWRKVARVPIEVEDDDRRRVTLHDFGCIPTEQVAEDSG